MAGRLRKVYDLLRMTDQKRLKRLQNACSLTLDRYMAIAQYTCAQCRGLNCVPGSQAEIASVLLWEMKEDTAREAYAHARLELLNFLTPGRDRILH